MSSLSLWSGWGGHRVENRRVLGVGDGKGGRPVSLTAKAFSPGALPADSALRENEGKITTLRFVGLGFQFLDQRPLLIHCTGE